MMQLPAPLARAFEDKLTIPVGELCSLLPIDRKTLYRHINAGHIAWVQLGMGDRAVRRGFTLKAVMRFLEDRERVVSPKEPGSVRRSSASSSDGFLAMHARMAAEAESGRAAHALRGRLAAVRAQRVAERKAKLQQ